MKKSLLLLVAIIATATAWSQQTVVNVVEQTVKVSQQSTLYAGEVVLDGQPSFYYLYSEDLKNSETVFAAVRDCLSDFKDGNFSALMANIIGETENLGIAVCSNNSYEDIMNSDWTSAVNAGQACLSSTTVNSSSSVDLYETDADFAAKCIGEDFAECTFIDDEGNDVTVSGILGKLATDITDDVTYTVIDGNLVKLINRHILYTCEMVTVIYTKVELETAGSGVTIESVNYIDENRETKNHEAIELTGDETSLGVDEQESWYVASGTLNYTQTLTIAGDVHLILADGAVMNIGTEAAPVSGYGIDGSECEETTLTIYGQTLDDDTAGHLNINTDDYCIEINGDYAQHSGNVTLNSSDGGGVDSWFNFTFTGGTLYITVDENAIYTSENVDILGGKLSAVCVGNYWGIFTLQGDVTLGWKNADDEITISNLTNGGSNCTMKIADGQAFTDGENIYDSTTPSAVLWALTNVTLRPVATFAISLPTSFEHGTVTCDKQTAAQGQTVTLTVTPDNGYKLETLTVTIVDANTSDGAPMRLRGGTVELTEGENGTYTFQMPAQPVTVNATFKKKVPTAIEEINADSRSGQRYNLMGQPVGKDYRGIVIEDGQKLIVK